MKESEFYEKTKYMTIDEFIKFCLENFKIVAPDPRGYINAPYQFFRRDYDLFNFQLKFYLEKD